ncbi:hypothetical protein OG211_14700 [Streptomyces niveus]|uniref:hypothetical protein n=1 Tax=Streptomyces niveus TaxID=193462 RepID=UPI003869BDD5|nr:hypothetical protein OG211_14700 [Streptomyces niveus]
MFYFGSAPTGTPVLIGAPPWVAALLGTGHLAVSAYIFGHWIRRRRQWEKQAVETRMPALALNVIWMWLIVVLSISTQYK